MKGQEIEFCQNPDPRLLALLMTSCALGVALLAAGAARDYPVVGALFGLLAVALLLAAPWTCFCTRRFFTDGTHLIARNRISTVRIPIARIDHFIIPGNILQRRGGIVIVFDGRTPIGRQVRVLPRHWITADEAAQRPPAEVIAAITGQPVGSAR